MARNETFDVRDDRFDDGDEPSGPAPRRGWSTSAKWILGILGVIGVMMLLCCGGIVWQVQRFAKQIENAFTEDPKRIGEIQDSITAIDIPADLPPQGGGDVDVFGLFKMKMAIYGAEHDRLLMLMEMQVAGLSKEDMAKQFKQQAGARGSEEIRVESSETKTFTINGEECDFVFAKGVRSNAGNAGGPDGEAAEKDPAAAPGDPAESPAVPVPTEQEASVPAVAETPAEAPPQPGAARQVTGMFPSRNGMAFLMLIVPEEKWNEAEVIKMIESIHK